MRAASGNLPGSYRRPEKAWRPGAWPGYKNTPGAQWSNIDRGELRPPVIWASLAPGWDAGSSRSRSYVRGARTKGIAWQAAGAHQASGKTRTPA
jgi:hypothetical protein